MHRGGRAGLPPPRPQTGLLQQRDHSRAGNNLSISLNVKVLDGQHTQNGCQPVPARIRSRNLAQNQHTARPSPTWAIKPDRPCIEPGIGKYGETDHRPPKRSQPGGTLKVSPGGHHRFQDHPAIPTRIRVLQQPDWHLVSPEVG